ncbi:MAG: DUF1638 domain-containing protein [Lentisphaerae bacterium]|nr:DUF1638 domain-containing protein [Lentisphaerota bacterium]
MNAVERKHFKVIACNVLRRETYLCAARSPHVTDIVMLPQGLHDQPDLLRETLQREIASPLQPHRRPRADMFETIPLDAERPYDAVLLVYALCSNGAAGLKAGACPLVIPRAHDCMTLLLGSAERYRTYFERHPGTYWYSSGWLETCPMPGKLRYEQTLAYYRKTYGEDNAQYLMEVEADWYRNYRRAAYIDWHFPHAEAEKTFTRQCADELKWEYDELAGDASLMQRLMDGAWSDKEFLVLQPGEVSDADPAKDCILKRREL